MNKCWIQFLLFGKSNLDGSNAKSEFQQTSKELTLTGSKTRTPTIFLNWKLHVELILFEYWDLYLKL